jgi:hypothetical protein
MGVIKLAVSRHVLFRETNKNDLDAFSILRSCCGTFLCKSFRYRPMILFLFHSYLIFWFGSGIQNPSFDYCIWSIINHASNESFQLNIVWLSSSAHHIMSCLCERFTKDVSGHLWLFDSNKSFVLSSQKLYALSTNFYYFCSGWVRIDGLTFYC